MKRRTRIGLAALATGVLAALWLALSPGWSLNAMRDAARAGDVQRIAGYVDVKEVRTSIAEQIAVRMTYAQSGAGKPIDPATAMAALRTARIMADQIDPVPTITTMVSGTEEARISRSGLNSFIAGPTAPDGGLEFRLEGVTWRVVGIRPPGRK